MECEPVLRPDVVKVAEPLPFSVPVPRSIVPSLKVTVPVGAPAPGATTFTVAVKVTDWPVIDGFRDEATLVVVLALFTV
jgi:hypothetical protein